MKVRERNVLESEGLIMNFEKRQNYNGIVPLRGCSGCSNQGSGVYNTFHTAQASSNAGRCSNC